MRKLTYPNFILGVISFIILFIGIGLRANSYQNGNYVIGVSAVLGGIHWIWSIIDVFRDRNLASNIRIIWLIAVIVVPGFGSLIYYLTSYRKNKLV